MFPSSQNLDPDAGSKTLILRRILRRPLLRQPGRRRLVSAEFTKPPFVRRCRVGSCMRSLKSPVLQERPPQRSRVVDQASHQRPSVTVASPKRDGDSKVALEDAGVVLRDTRGPGSGGGRAPP